MPGYEVMGAEERAAILEWFDSSNGVMFAHGFDGRRNGVFKVREFERAVATTVGARHAQVVSSGTAALLVGLQALGVKPGDEVVTQAFTFVASVEAILAAGATPVIVPVDRSLTMSPDHFRRAITPRTKVVMPVHMAGAAADMDRILEIAAERGVMVLEDAAQAFGGTYRGRHLGTIGNAGVFSFDFAKNITTGEGGAVVTNDTALYERARALHDHGHEYNAAFPRGRDTRHAPGFNFRMTEVQAAVGLAQLKKLPMILERQRANKARIKGALADCGVDFRHLHDSAGDIADTLIFFLSSEEQAGHMADGLKSRGLGTKNLPDALDWHFAGTWSHMLPHVADVPGDLLRRAIALPVNVRMSDQEILSVIDAVRSLAPKTPA